MRDFLSSGCKKLSIVAITAATTVACTTMNIPGSSNRFEFGVIGDVPYNDQRKTELGDLLGEVAANDVEFLVHAGDIKSGSTECTDELFADRRALFDTSETPLIYITGDNEWTDCHRENNGSFDPIERLGKLRDVFFDTDQSLGTNTITLKRQEVYKENVIWTRESIVFVGLNIQGSNNGQNQKCPTLFADACPSLDDEFPIRNVANLEWLRQAFDMAENTNAPAIAVFIQGNPFRYYLPAPGQTPRKKSTFPISVPLEGFSSGYLDFLTEFRARAAQFGKPVLIVHGDTHTHRIDKPYTGQVGQLFGEAVEDGGFGDGLHPILNVTRMETYGNPVTRWTRVRVDTSSPAVFSFEDGSPAN